MATTRSQLRQDTFRIMDAYQGSTYSSRWDTTSGSTGEADRIGGLVHLREWKKLLNHVPTFRVAQRTPTTDANGQITLTDLNAGSADALQTWYRVLQVSFGNRTYQDITNGAQDYLLATTESNPRGVYYRAGSYLVVPDSPLQTATGVWVNYVPTALHALSGDNVAVDLPGGSDDYAGVVAYEWAGMLLMKGGAETEASQYCKAMAAELRSEMLDDLRPSGGPIEFRYADSSGEWGSTV